MRVVLCAAEEIHPGEKRCFRVGRERLVLVRSSDGRFHALKDACPHQGAQLCAGVVLGSKQPADEVGVYAYEEDALVLRCPWHGFEFDVETGQSLFEPERLRVRRYPVSLDESGGVTVELERRESTDESGKDFTS